MFYIDKYGGIHISRGDSAEILTCPEKALEDGSTEPIILTKNACVIFTVRSRYSGEILIRRTLTYSDYFDGVLILRIFSSETDAEPCGYDYSFEYMPDSGDPERSYTYAQGEFDIMYSAGNDFKE